MGTRHGADSHPETAPPLPSGKADGGQQHGLRQGARGTVLDEMALRLPTRPVT